MFLVPEILSKTTSAYCGYIISFYAMGAIFKVAVALAASTFGRNAIFFILPTPHDLKKVPRKNQALRPSLNC